MRVLCASVLAGCWMTSPVEAPQPRPPPSEIVISEQRFGPLDASSPATLAHVRAQFPELEVRPKNDPGLEYHAFAGSDELFFVVTDEHLAIFNIHATSPRVRVHDRDWRVGSAFHDARSLSRCECWGEQPTCYRRGEHVAVSFARGCDGVVGVVDRRDLDVLDGLAPQRVIWSPTAFGSIAEVDGVDDLRGGSANGDDDDF